MSDLWREHRSGNADVGRPGIPCSFRSRIEGLCGEILMTKSFSGMMFIGDPHLEARIPGFRSDSYPQAALEKLAWCLDQARSEALQPFLLGDLFHLPQDNPNWLVTEVIRIITEHYGEGLPAIYGNHDVRENTLKPNDTLSILFAGGHLRLLSHEHPWQGLVAGRKAIVGGTVWGDRLPQGYDVPASDDQHSEPAVDLVAWLTHHDILIPGYEEAGRIRPAELPGIDVVINGHVHRRLDPVLKGDTHWVTAGNITRRSRSDASRLHVPAVPCLVPADDPKVIADDAIGSLAITSQGGTAWSLRW